VLPEVWSGMFRLRPAPKEMTASGYLPVQDDPGG